MRGKPASEVQTSPASDGKAPRTARGERTLRKILDAARDEFGQRGFSDSSIVGITQRAGVALGTFYTYFDSKEAVFQEVVRDMSAQVRDRVAPEFKSATDAIDGERRALEAFLKFAREHRDVYRIIDEAEFVEPEGFREHYQTTATRIAGAAGRGTRQGRHRSGPVRRRSRHSRLGDDGRERVPRAALFGLVERRCGARCRRDQPDA